MWCFPGSGAVVVQLGGNFLQLSVHRCQVSQRPFLSNNQYFYISMCTVQTSHDTWLYTNSEICRKSAFFITRPLSTLCDYELSRGGSVLKNQSATFSRFRVKSTFTKSLIVVGAL